MNEKKQEERGEETTRSCGLPYKTKCEGELLISTSSPTQESKRGEEEENRRGKERGNEEHARTHTPLASLKLIFGIGNDMAVSINLHIIIKFILKNFRKIKR